MTERKFVNVQLHDEKLIAVADDGTAWIANTKLTTGVQPEHLKVRVVTNWVQIAPLPQIDD